MRFIFSFDKRTTEVKNMAITGQAQKYVAAWEAGLYEGFSERTSARHSTPLLEGLISNLQNLGEDRELTRVLEAGVGLGSHALRLVQEGFLVIANEYCETATNEILRKIAKLSQSSQIRIKVAHGDILDCLRAQEYGSVAGFYAHSVFHTFSPKERRELYAEIGNVQPIGGIIAVSFKAEGDYVQNMSGTTSERSEAGLVITDYAGGISRLFVTDITPLVREFLDAGYRVLNTYKWDIPKKKGDVENPLEFRKFVGLLAKKTEGDRK